MGANQPVYLGTKTAYNQILDASERVITTATFGWPSPDCIVVTVTEEQQKNEPRQHYCVDGITVRFPSF